MGPRLKLPPYVHAFVDRHGKARFYFRKLGFKRVSLPGLPWSPEFMTAYELAAAAQPVSIGISQIRPGTFRALAASYLASPAFQSKRPTTKYSNRNIIDRLCREHGDKRVALLRQDHVVKLIAAHADKPRTANALRSMLRILMQHAVATGMRADDPTHGVRAVPMKSVSFHSWTEAEIGQFEQPSGRLKSPACLWPAAIYRPTPLRRYSHGTPACGRWRARDPAAENRAAGLDSHS
jgi:hypothetical protein